MYGLADDTTDGLFLRLGADHAKGGRGGLTLSIGSLMRLRANPFFSVMEERTQSQHLQN